MCKALLKKKERSDGNDQDIKTADGLPGTAITPPAGTTSEENPGIAPLQDAAGTNQTAPADIDVGAAPVQTAAPAETVPAQTAAPTETVPTQNVPGEETAPRQTDALQTAIKNEAAAQGQEVTENGSGTAQDDIDEKLLNTVQEVSGTEGKRSGSFGGKGDDPYFDLPPVKWKESSSAPITTDGEAQTAKETIGKLRESGLYQAVSVSRLLKNNKSNPIATGIFSRVINSSKWSTVSDLNAGVSGLNSFLTAFDDNSKRQSFYQVVSLATNLISVVTSLRNIYLKVKGMQFKASADAWIKNLILGVGIVGDFSMAFAKSVAIAKTIAKFAKADLPILKKVSNWMFLATGTSQAIALATTSQALIKGLSEISRTKMKKAEVWEKAKVAVRSTLGTGKGAQLALQAGDTEAEEDTETAADGSQETTAGPEQTAAGETVSNEPEQTAAGENASNGAKEAAAPAENEKTAKNAEKNRKKELKKKDMRKSGSRLSRAEKALRVLEQQDGEGELLSEESKEKNKDDLVAYIGLAKRIKKQEHDEAALLASGINLIFGLGGTVISGGKFVTDEGKKRSDKEGWKTASDVFAYGTTGSGVIVNSTTMLTSAGKIISRATNHEDEESEVVKERLFHKIDILGQDEHGLKYLEESLVSAYAGGSGSGSAEEEQQIDAARTEILTKATDTAKLYHDTGEMLDMMGTPVAKLSGAKNLKAFKKILVSGLV